MNYVDSFIINVPTEIFDWLNSRKLSKFDEQKLMQTNTTYDILSVFPI